MREDLAIRLTNLTMELPTYRKVPRRHSSNGFGSLKASVGGRLNFSRGSMLVVTALDDVSLEIARGEKIGLIGLNGAGKSTMLKVMAGILPPTHGTAESRGKISTLFAESLGLKPEATGIENILLSGVSLGLTHGRVRKMIPEIVEFTELGDYIYMPLRTYSNGMRARLGFAVATSINPDILLIDEIIGAGDLRFQEKARERLEGFMGSANTLVVASQSEDVIRAVLRPGDSPGARKGEHGPAKWTRSWRSTRGRADRAEVVSSPILAHNMAGVLSMTHDAAARDAGHGRRSRDRVSQAYPGLVDPGPAGEGLRRRIDWMADQAQGPRALDARGNGGILALLLARRGIEVTAVEPDPEAVEHARGLLAEGTGRGARARRTGPGRTSICMHRWRAHSTPCCWGTSSNRPTIRPRCWTGAWSTSGRRGGQS